MNLPVYCWLLIILCRRFLQNSDDCRVWNLKPQTPRPLITCLERSMETDLSNARVWMVYWSLLNYEPINFLKLNLQLGLLQHYLTMFLPSNFYKHGHWDSSADRLRDYILHASEFSLRPKRSQWCHLLCQCLESISTITGVAFNHVDRCEWVQNRLPLSPSLGSHHTTLWPETYPFLDPKQEGESHHNNLYTTLIRYHLDTYLAPPCYLVTSFARYLEPGF